MKVHEDVLKTKTLCFFVFFVDDFIKWQFWLKFSDKPEKGSGNVGFA